MAPINIAKFKKPTHKEVGARALSTVIGQPEYSPRGSCISPVLGRRSKLMHKKTALSGVGYRLLEGAKPRLKSVVTGGQHVQ